MNILGEEIGEERKEAENSKLGVGTLKSCLVVGGYI
jgi:hypothetical protein